MRAAARLVDLGYQQVFEYPGGWKEWVEVVGTLESSEPEAPAPAP